MRLCIVDSKKQAKEEEEGDKSRVKVFMDGLGTSDRWEQWWYRIKTDW